MHHVPAGTARRVLKTVQSHHYQLLPASWYQLTTQRPIFSLSSSHHNNAPNVDSITTMTEQSSAATTQNYPGRRSFLANSANPQLIPGSSRLVDTSSLPLRVGGSTAGQSHHIPPQEDALQQPHHAHHHFMIDPNSPAIPRLSPNTPDANFPYNNNANNNNLHSTHRHMTLWDLLSLGVGGTVGSGIFVLTGQIASQMAGPATVLSWSLAGVAAVSGEYR